MSDMITIVVEVVLLNESLIKSLFFALMCFSDGINMANLLLFARTVLSNYQYYDFRHLYSKDKVKRKWTMDQNQQRSSASRDLSVCR